MKFIACWALLLMLVVPLSASSVLPLNFTQLSQGANHIVGGRVIDITSSRDPDTGYIYSRVTVSVADAVPSQLIGRQYSFRMIGGAFEGKRLHIADYPTFEVDQTVVLFLNRQTSTVFGPTLGLYQGVFFVEKDATSAREAVTDHKGLPIVGVRDQTLVRGSRVITGEKTSTAILSGPGQTALRMSAFFDAIRARRNLASAGAR